MEKYSFRFRLHSWLVLCVHSQIPSHWLSLYKCSVFPSNCGDVVSVPVAVDFSGAPESCCLGGRVCWWGHKRCRCLCLDVKPPRLCDLCEERRPVRQRDGSPQTRCLRVHTCCMRVRAQTGGRGRREHQPVGSGWVLSVSFCKAVEHCCAVVFIN